MQVLSLVVGKTWSSVLNNLGSALLTWRNIWEYATLYGNLTLVGKPTHSFWVSSRHMPCTQARTSPVHIRLYWECQFTLLYFVFQCCRELHDEKNRLTANEPNCRYAYYLDLIFHGISHLGCPSLFSVRCNRLAKLFLPRTSVMSGRQSRDPSLSWGSTPVMAAYMSIRRELLIFQSPG